MLASYFHSSFLHSLPQSSFHYITFLNKFHLLLKQHAKETFWDAEFILNQEECDLYSCVDVVRVVKRRGVRVAEYEASRATIFL